MKTFKILLVLLVIGIMAMLLFIYSGLYSVAASNPHAKATEWVLGTVMDRSVSRHAKRIQAPDLNATNMVQEGFEHYREMCVVCHGAPGQDPTEIARGLNPSAPDLAGSANDMTPAELFWVTKNGVKMTGMPSFGATHSDGKIWAIVAFLERLRTLTTDEYKAMSATGVHNDGHD